MILFSMRCKLVTLYREWLGKTNVNGHYVADTHDNFLAFLVFHNLLNEDAVKDIIKGVKHDC